MGIKRKRGLELVGDNPETAFCGDVNLGDGELLRAAVSRLALGFGERSRQKHFEKAWQTFEENSVVATIVELKLSFLNSRLSINIEGGPKKFDLDAARSGWINHWIEDLLRRRLVQDTIVTIWGQGIEPTNLPVERCELKSILGQETITFEHGYAAQDIPEQWRTAFKNPKVNLSDIAGIDHLHLTRPSPKGFGAPALWRANLVTDQLRHMEVGENLTGFLSRTVIRQHELGHEIKNGPRAGRDDHFWNQKWSDSVKKSFLKTGFVEFTSRFDHKINIHGVDPKLFDSKKWESPLNRLMWWAGPIGFMLVAKTPNPFLMGLFREECLAERARLGPYIRTVLEGFIGNGAKISVRWGNRCFSDPRLAMEGVKFLTQQGPLSLETALDETGFDPIQERARKKNEAKDDLDVYLPIHDPNHGDQPGKKAGRKPGTKDPHTP